jgi:hypothetical protein
LAQKVRKQVARFPARNLVSGVMNIDKKMVKKAPGFDKKDCPDSADLTCAETNEKRFVHRPVAKP